jgi:putative heme-binding domain-containing protein
MILTGILDPNQAVETRYLGYTAITSNGREVTGVLTASTPASITLRTAGGTEEVVLRTELRDLNSSGLSLMPEGLETTLTPQGMADLISFIRARSHDQ